ncbi:MAG: type I secretion system permease/ATPase [Thermodesulfobacteriota bacterium]
MTSATTTPLTTSTIAGGWQTGTVGQTGDDPLLDCLVQLTKLFGRDQSRNALSAGLPLVDNRLTVELFPRAAKRAGLSTKIVKRALSDITPLALPVVLLLQSRQACVLIDTAPDGETHTVLPPESGGGAKTISRQALEELYTGYAFFVQPSYRFQDRTLDDIAPRPKNWFWGTLFASWRMYRDVLIASLLINLFTLATPFFILNVYDRVIPNAAHETLWVLVVGIIGIYLFELLLRGLRGYFIDDAGKKSNLRISSQLFEKVLGLRMEVKPKSVGAFAKNLQQFENIRDFITSFSITALIDMPFVAIGLAAIWYFAGNMVWIQIIAIVVLLLFSIVMQLPLKQAVEASFHASSQKNAILVEGLNGLETVKLLGAEGQLQRAWEEAESYISRWNVRSRLLSSSVTHVASFVQNLAVVLLVVLGVYKISQGELTQGGLIACIILSRRTLTPMTQVVNLATRFHRAKTSYDVLKRIMELPEERPAGKQFLQRSRFAGKIGLKNIGFRYPEQTTDTLKNVTLEIAPGERVALIGPIGSGKTTIGKLILGLYQPTEGMVSMDDTDIRQIDPAELRHFIGYVPQDVTLFRGTVRDNIVFGTHDVDDATILHAAEMAGVADFVKKHPAGYDMEIGEQGRGLSGGQRQTVAIARALLLDPPVLVMDEPSSSMDNRTETRLKTNLAPLLAGKTVILITHRASLLDLVDRIVVIDNGTVVADGPKQRIVEALKNGQLKI